MGWDDDGCGEGWSTVRLDMDADRHVPLDFTPREPKPPVVHNVRLLSEHEGHPPRLVGWSVECATCSWWTCLYRTKAKAEAMAVLHRDGEGGA